MFADKMRQHLRIGLRDELVSPGRQALPEELVILDDAIVDQRDLAGLIEMRMSVGVGRRSVRRPTGMADTGGAFGGSPTPFIGITTAAGPVALLSFSAVSAPTALVSRGLLATVRRRALCRWLGRVRYLAGKGRSAPQ